MSYINPLEFVEEEDFDIDDLFTLPLGELSNEDLLSEVMDYIDGDAYDPRYSALEQELLTRLKEAGWLDE